MAIHIVGTRKPAKLGTHVPVPVAPACTNPNAMYYVVNRNAALTLQGYKACKCKSFTYYGVYRTQAQANAHIAAKHMGLYACVIAM